MGGSVGAGPGPALRRQAGHTRPNHRDGRAARCLLSVVKSAKEAGAISRVWHDWADNWLKGEDRTPEATEKVINFLNSAPKNNFFEAAARLATWAALHSWRDLCAAQAAKSIQMVRAHNSLDLMALLNRI